MDAPFWYPQAEENQYLNQMNRGADVEREQINARSKDNTDTTRELGKLYGEMPMAAVKGYQSGQDQALKKSQVESGLESQAQQRELAGSEEQRAQGRYGNEQTEAGYRQRGMKATEEERNAQDAYNKAPGNPEDATAVGLQPGASRGDIARAQTYRQGGANLAATNQNIAASRAAVAGSAADQHRAQETYVAGNAAEEMQQAAMEPNPQLRQAKVEDVRSRYSAKLPPARLSNMADAAVQGNAMKLKQISDERDSTVRLAQGQAVQEGHEKATKVKEAMEMQALAKQYQEHAHAGGAYEDPNAKDAREKVATILARHGDLNAANKVQSAFFAQARGILPEQTAHHALQTANEFHQWYDTQDPKVQNLPEIKQALTQADALAMQYKGQADDQNLPVISTVGAGGPPPNQIPPFQQNPGLKASFQPGGGMPANADPLGLNGMKKNPQAPAGVYGGQ